VNASEIADDTSWVNRFKEFVERKPIVVLKFASQEWTSLQDSRYSLNEFTVARGHGLLAGVRRLTPCLMHGKSEQGEELYFGIINSVAAVTTLESRIKIKRGVAIEPRSMSELLRQITEKTHARNLKQRLRNSGSVVALSPKLSSHLVERLASIKSNRGPLRAVEQSLSAPKCFQDTRALQEDAVQMALRAFGLSPNDRAESLELVAGQETALARVGIIEDSVIEHDARQIPGYGLVQSHLTGRAVFERGNERLEVFTANRRSLERVFGVDLIYLNASRQNIVMLQYKMLEPVQAREDTDWIYRPDANLDKEIERMQKFAAQHAPGPFEYRINSGVFYLKFVKRNGLITSGGIIMPLEHFEKLRLDPACKGRNNGLRVSYDSLAGRYLRPNAFVDLVRAGYIGAHAETTAQLKVLIEAVLNNDRAVVAAIQRATGRTVPDDDEAEI
jgi:hypothetical protein